MKPLRLPLVALLALLAPGRADAQVLSRLPLSLHARVGAASPTGDFAQRSPGIAAEPGASFEVGGVLRLAPFLGLYAAWQQERFGCEECGAVSLDDRAVARGFEAGGEVSSPFRPLGLTPWARVGVVRHSLRFSREESSLSSEPGAGFGVGGGVRVPVGPVAISPGVRYQSYSVDVEFGGYPTRRMDVSQLTFDVGLLLPF